MNKADKLKYKALQKALETGNAKILLDCNRLNKPQSPVYNPWEVLIPMLTPLMVGLILFFCVGILFGLVFICAMIFMLNTFAKKYLYVRLIKRTKEFMMTDYESCQNLWEYGGIVLINTKDKKTGCVAPDGSWKDFVSLNFAEFMSEKKEQSQSSD
ncbi:MAG: hypothetical protein R3Y43_03220 [Alphaproteobacteria bacterium]